ncbi:hypothetical protein N798_15590 [Knoellia flava TL1]|uniref:Glycosyltransferase n=1 Tax=Knoellia flava TL1 TaxID=1385518 RepID=A0ABR4XAV7_9MICO|nr:hypothetical protein [Knoellia flava]KGN29034.1 hypothetical protein N798_15590 [Knoellia flava TL1]
MLISAGWMGGAGGAERALYSILRSLQQDEVDVVVRHRLDGEWSRATSARVALVDSPHWWGAGHEQGIKGRILQRVVNPARRLVHPRYDLYLQFLSGAFVAPAARASVRLLIPSGNQVPEHIADRFDAVAMQAPDNESLVPTSTRAVLLAPPVFDLAREAEPPAVALPDAFLLTVFNPYDPIKGMQDLAAVLATAPLPLVWCHSEATVKFEIPASLLEHPRIVHVTDANPAQLRHLYERCAAYVSFSLTEGFGWSAADALRYSPAVATRRIGLFSDEAAWRQPGVLTVGDDGGIDWKQLLGEACPPSRRDLGVIDGRTFRARLTEIVESFDG